MKKIFKRAMLFVAACTLSAGMVSCSDDNNGEGGGDSAANIDYNSTNAQQWANYMATVSNLLKNDAQTLYDQWNNGYAATFKTHNSQEYPSAISCVEQIFDGCIDIAGEVGDTKMGDPYNKYVAGKTTEALYAVESWYSWHSIEDYSNNIRSIRNAYFGTRDGSISDKSLSKVLAAKNPTMDTKAKSLIQGAIDAIEGITPPFRNHINSAETVTAMDACADLEDFISNELKPYFQGNINDAATLDPVITQYVDQVVMPTYKELAQLNSTLNDAVLAFKANPSNASFEASSLAWLNARAPWEQSEAFLFGPVDELQLDPNMDSWPLDQDQIVQILNSQDFNDLNWSKGDSDEKIESAQGLRGFHTLEFLIFKDGKARTVK